MKTEIADLKIRFADEMSEKWLVFWIRSDELADHDWNTQRIGMDHWISLSAMNKDETPACVAFLYRTKTQRVIVITAYREP